MVSDFTWSLFFKKFVFNCFFFLGERGKYCFIILYVYISSVLIILVEEVVFLYCVYFWHLGCCWVVFSSTPLVHVYFCAAAVLFLSLWLHSTIWSKMGAHPALFLRLLWLFRVFLCFHVGPISSLSSAVTMSLVFWFRLFWVLWIALG